MPYREPDPSDPSMLVGSVVDCTRDELYEMAAAFAGELAQLGYGSSRIRRMFRRASYAGPHLAWRELGETEILRLVDDAVRFWGHCRVVVRDGPSSDDPPKGLPAIDNTGGKERRRA
jgi:hypothetical protein